MKNTVFRTIFCIVLALCGFGSILYASVLPSGLDSQYAWQRWQGEGELPFTQFSCFLPTDGKLQKSAVYSFRTAMLNSFSSASIDISNGYQFADCWSCPGSASVYSEHANTVASLFAVGGNYFFFHPLPLISGSYISEEDFVIDNVLLDEELAWRLFGSSDIIGQTLTIFSVPFRVGGVVAVENDLASKKAYSGGMRLYMSYDAYKDLCGIQDEGITCYEVCLPDPVNGFASSVVNEKFPIGHGESVENRGRFDLLHTIPFVFDIPARSMHTTSAVYPYWENAARYTETLCAILYGLASVLLIYPLFTAGARCVFLFSKGREKLSRSYIPALRDDLEESVRIRQRRRWEKKHR